MCKTSNVHNILLGVIAIVFATYVCVCEGENRVRPSDLRLEQVPNPDIIIFPDNMDVQNNFPQYHREQSQVYHSYSPRKNEYPTTERPSQVLGKPKRTFKNDDNLIPLDFLHTFNTFENVSDLLLNFVEDDPELQQFSLSNRFGELERNPAVVPKAALCMPELQTVKIVTNDDPSVMYIPSCTRVERCGGCCSHSLLSCQPKETEIISFQVVKTKFTGGTKLKFMGKEIVPVEKHTKCKCDCKVQPKDCNKFQEYRKSECRCACINSDEEKKCHKNNATKLWNPDICACQCRDELQCSTGFSFDPNLCKCVQSPMRRRNTEQERNQRNGYKSEALPVLPLYEIPKDEENK